MTTETIVITNQIDSLVNRLGEALCAEINAWQALEQAKLNRVMVEAQAEQDIRERARRDGEKLTESAIAGSVSTDGHVLDARERVIAAEFEYRGARVDVQVAETRVSLVKATLYAESGRVV